MALAVPTYPMTWLQIPSNYLLVTYRTHPLPLMVIPGPTPTMVSRLLASSMAN